MAARACVPVTYFGVGDKPQYERYVAALNLNTNDAGCPEFTLRLPNGQEHLVSSKLIGEHHVHNLLAAATIAYNAGIAGDRIAHALNTSGAVSKWRMARTDRSDGVSIINDAYNANPESMSAALRTLAQLGRGSEPRRTWAVLGAMLELGESSVEEHDHIGRLAVRLNISKLIAVGDTAKPIYNAAHLEGSWGNEATWVQTPQQALSVLRAELRPGDIVLFKSSNGAKLGQLGDEVAFSSDRFGSGSEPAPTWLSAGDFVEVTDLTGSVAPTASEPATTSSPAATTASASTTFTGQEGTR